MFKSYHAPHEEEKEVGGRGLGRLDHVEENRQRGKEIKGKKESRDRELVNSEKEGQD